VRSTPVKYRFRKGTFEFWFEWLVGAQTHGGSEASECFYAASRIKDGDPRSWVREWLALGERIEARANEALFRRHSVSARECFLRASLYYRAARLYLSVHDPRYQELWQKSVACFRGGARLLAPPLEPVEIPFEKKALPGYFLKVDTGQEPRKTLVMIGGGDTFVEDLYFYIGPAAVKRGYHVLMVDLPGQGGLPFEGMTMRPDAEAPMGAVLDHASRRLEIDTERLAVYGISGGGYLVPRAASFDKRIKACIACSAIPNFYEYMTQGRRPNPIIRLEGTWLFHVLVELAKRRSPASQILIETYLWRWGARRLAEWMEMLKTFNFDRARFHARPSF